MVKYQDQQDIDIRKLWLGGACDFDEIPDCPHHRKDKVINLDLDIEPSDYKSLFKKK